MSYRIKKNTMNINLDEINAKIFLKKSQIQNEVDSDKKVELNKQLRKLQLKKEIEVIKMKIIQLS